SFRLAAAARRGQTAARPQKIMNASPIFRLALCFLISTAVTVARADDFKLEPGVVSLYTGKDLTGWGFRTNNFDGKIDSSDGRYSANGDILVVHPHTPRVVEAMWTTRQFPKDFILKLEFRAEYNADSGLFVRNPQLQV